MLRLAINGYGRIGRHVLRAWFERGCPAALGFVAINDLGAAETLVHLTRYDSTHGRFYGEANLIDGHLAMRSADGQQVCMIPLYNQALPENLPWQALAVDVVLECTGQFRAKAEAARHVQAGAKKVIIGAAPFDEVDATIVYGVNHQQLTNEQKIISSVSCTTHALVPMMNILDEAFGIDSALMTEIHAVTSDQVLLDHTHRDLRRGRAAAHNIIPTTSSSIGAVKRVLPHLADKIDGYSIRVPTLNVAAVDLSFVAQRPISKAAINQLFSQKAAHEYAQILAYCDEWLVSSDFNHSPYSLIFDATETRVVGQQAKVLAWYDNEWGYANRLLDLCLMLARMH
ncbi:type I glyceraldehyde-3-phosphate dehydrogenase [Agitococcus lubricus]|uniref:Glyceraldehyde 3-phosphate dehydrogenase n=1 Tax=Agitococcus lubricus TaxID=1077255 RepID=A0A2T5J2Q0_9GAMM|nr:type I glyceraldehyde-3-phosphate dehydrogenase [Agitococcus lubricus]PTQ90795.1 glyceraldehyde 3-phosphate dehydrogenase [Agitococcus lubricus]